MTRPEEILRGVEKIFPDMWKSIEGFIESREEMGNWPAWCFLPMAGAYSIASGGGSNRIPADRMRPMQILAAVIPWRMTKGIYTFDETLLEELWQTPVGQELPIEVLFRLPEWGIYVATPTMQIMDKPMYGFFAYLEYDVENRRAELRVLLDLVEEPIPVVVYLDHATLYDCLQQAIREGERQAAMAGFLIRDSQKSEIKTIAKHFEPILSLLLYICSTAADIAGVADKQPKRPIIKNFKSFTPPPAARSWDVGTRIGAALRKAKQASASAEATGTGTGKRPHVRRAHWHTYWTGSRSAGQIPDLKWLSPILVKVNEDTDLPTTIRSVE